MRIALLTSDESLPGITDALKNSIEGKIADAEVELLNSRTNSGIVKKISSLSGFDVAMVVVIYRDENASVKSLIDKITSMHHEGIELIEIIEPLSAYGDEDADEEKTKADIIAKAESVFMAELLK